MVLEDPRRPTVVVSSCIYCGSTNIARGVRVNQTADAGRIGISYRTGFIVWGTEPFLADLCDDCGSVVRIFVETPGRKWATK